MEWNLKIVVSALLFLPDDEDRQKPREADPPGGR